MLQNSYCPQQDGRVYIMSAGMHYAVCPAPQFVALIFFYGEGVHVSAKCDAVGGARFRSLYFHQKSGFTDVLDSVNMSFFTQFFFYESACIIFFKAQLGIFVDLLADCINFRF